MSRVEPSDNKRSSSLDLSREAIDQLSAQATELVTQYFSTISERRVFPDTYAGKLNTLIDTELRVEGESLEKLLDECRTVIELSRHNGHPRFFGYVASPSTPIGAYADLIGSAFNSNITCWRSAPGGTEIEKVVVRWLGSLIGYDSDARGLLTSGGSMANMIAILTASRRRSGHNVSNSGLWNCGAPLTLYVSEEVHMSVPKAADILGLGRDNVRTIKCDESLRMNVEDLRRAIQADLAKELRPFCVVGSAGTVGTGVVDPLDQIADVAREYDLWFHIDGAYGAPAVLNEEKKDLFRGMERADSLSLDPHKWLYVPVDAGCLLFRDDETFRGTFSSQDADYIKRHGYADDEAFAFWDYGVELSRRFRALKVWLTLRYYGTRKIAAAIGDDMKLAAYLGELVDRAEDFELLSPVELSICCFRYVPHDLRGELSTGSETDAQAINERLNQLNARIMNKVQTGGRAYLSNANVRGRFALRACITNFRTTKADIEETVEIIREAALECDAT
ncbi:MAG TPA: pyridoxal-dependent decarboxylase [Pyrinomonadaceae bacterium]|nr:pyridoxal-dependent decarboxylase [Pyrinomonadaceae bacterium]